MSTTRTLRPEAECATPVTFAMHCTVCGAASRPDPEFEAAHDWATQHLDGNPTHTTYREVIHRHWRAS
ncbi:hypothetical protein [Streptomyces orinoci]|uniref:DUF7848 domain-containing protein n=1 Tax=Streptomyces orinoci TaxID=67339 RepID=A0ABV3K1X2_STRON|nr:hypothetical protein [Streptomyces orinoci]